jgi:hypothetical protein
MQRPRGQWVNYDDEILVAEMRTIPQPDRGLLPLAYKKESDEAPESLIRAARERRGRYIERRKTK